MPGNSYTSFMLQVIINLEIDIFLSENKVAIATSVETISKSK